MNKLIKVTATCKVKLRNVSKNLLLTNLVVKINKNQQFQATVKSLINEVRAMQSQVLPLVWHLRLKRSKKCTNLRLPWKIKSRRLQPLLSLLVKCKNKSHPWRVWLTTISPKRHLTRISRPRTRLTWLCWIRSQNRPQSLISKLTPSLRTNIWSISKVRNLLNQTKVFAQLICLILKLKKECIKMTKQMPFSRMSRASILIWLLARPQILISKEMRPLL